MLVTNVHRMQRDELGTVYRMYTLLAARQSTVQLWNHVVVHESSRDVAFDFHDRTPCGRVASDFYQVDVHEPEDDFIDSPTAGHVWAVGRLAAWAMQRPAMHQWVEDRHVLELGSGTGISGISAARAGASTVILSDRQPTLSLLRQNIARNARWFKKHNEQQSIGSLQAIALNWSDVVTTLPLPHPVDTLLASDVLFNEAVQDAFVKGICDLWPLLESPLNSRDRVSLARPRAQLLMIEIERSKMLLDRAMALFKAAGFFVTTELLTDEVHLHDPEFVDNYGADTAVFWMRITRS